jgi:hypothetical protein
MPLNNVQAVQSTGLLKTANNLSEIRAYTDQLMGVGDVKLIAAAVAPKGWLACNGASVSTTTYSALFAKIAYTFGGSGANFTLPNISAPVANTLYIIKASEYTP